MSKKKRKSIRRVQKSKVDANGVMIAMPIHKNCLIHIRVADFCFKACKLPWIGWLHEPNYVAEIGRNTLIANILDFHPEVTHIFFLDADTLPPKDTILKLLAHDKDIVAGAYPLMGQGKKCWNMSISEEMPQSLVEYKDLPAGLFKATAIGGSTVLIKREVFERMEFPWFKTICERGITHMGHDFYFANKARKLGYEIWVDPTIKCNHYQNDIDLLEMFERI